MTAVKQVTRLTMNPPHCANSLMVGLRPPELRCAHFMYLYMVHPGVTGVTVIFR